MTVTLSRSDSAHGVSKANVRLGVHDRATRGRVTLTNKWNPEKTLAHDAKRTIDIPLVAGSAAFGIGWGISGFCPGGAIPALGFGGIPTFAFVGAMVAGLVIGRTLRHGNVFAKP